MTWSYNWWKIGGVNFEGNIQAKISENSGGERHSNIDFGLQFIQSQRAPDERGLHLD